MRIVFDRDTAGRRHALAVAEALDIAGANVSFRGPEPRKKGSDLSDHLNAGYSLADLALGRPPRSRRQEGRGGWV